MKLIYLPTNRQLKMYESMAKQLLQNHPDQYIRAELPEHWRVEGYDKSWEWGGFISKLNFVGINNFGQFCTNVSKDIGLISRAEFEYHIYNPWREGKYAGTFGNENRIEDEPTPYIETSFPRASQAGLIEDPANGLLKDPTKPRIDYEKASVDYLQTLAESMGYELVKKEKQAIRWESEENRYTLVDGGLHIVEKESEEGVFIKDEEIEEMIEKYNVYNEKKR